MANEIIEGMDAKIGHTDVLEDGVDNAQYVKLNVSKYKKTQKKDNTYIPRPRQYSSHNLGPKTFAYDTIEIEQTWTITAFVQEASVALSHTNMVNANGNIDVSGEAVDFSGSSTFIPLGAPKIKYDSETLTNTTDNTTVSDSNYNMDYDRGYIEATGLDQSDNYEISYTCKGSKRNMARIVERMSIRGGAGSLIFDPDDFTVSGSAGAEDGSVYTVQFDNVEWTANAGTPDEVELSLDLRVAIDYEGQ